MLFGNTQINLPSRFMDEIDHKYLDIENNKPSILGSALNFVKEDKFRKEDVQFTVTKEGNAAFIVDIQIPAGTEHFDTLVEIND